MKEHKIVKAIPLDDNCFATHEKECEGVGLKVYVTDDKHVVGLVKTKTCHQGYEGTIHGGIISTYFDEVLWYATIVDDEDTLAVTAELTVKYLKAVPVEEDIWIIAKPMRRDGRHIYVDGYILLSDGRVAAEATAHFIVVKPGHAVGDSEVMLYYSDDEMPETAEF